MELDAASRAQAQHEQAIGQSPTFDLENIKGPVHFVGIGGIGMSAIARLLLAEGKAVSGSDKSGSEITEELERLGAKVFIGHHASNVKDAGALVVSTAIEKSNPELVAAQEAGLPVCHRSDLLKMLSRSSKLIAISGTHGKTTTTGMIAQMLIDCGVDPSVVVGGIFERIGSNSRHGKGGFFVAEADESDRTHAEVTSYISVLTNIEEDHLENYPGGIKQIRDVMISFANHSEHAVVICVDDDGCRAIMPSIENKLVTYGRRTPQSPATYTYEGTKGFSMQVYKEGRLLGEVQLAVPGEHNKLNALAAIAVGLELKLDFAGIAAALSGFKGVDRRFQIIGEESGILIVDDYAHHPTEVVATLQAAKQFIKEQGEHGQSRYKRVVALFQPHQPGRLRDFWDDFCAAFKDADIALIADVYVARGAEIEGINSQRFVQSVSHPDVHYKGGPTGSLAASVVEHLKPGDLVMTIGAGDITRVGPDLLMLLKQGRSGGSSK